MDKKEPGRTDKTELRFFELFRQIENCYGFLSRQSADYIEKENLTDKMF